MRSRCRRRAGLRARERSRPRAFEDGVELRDLGLEVSAAAAPSATLGALLVVFGVAAVVIVPSMALLYVLDQRSLLPEEGADSRPAAGARRSPGVPPGPEALAPARPRLGQFPLATLADVARLPGKPSGVTQALCTIRTSRCRSFPRASSGFSRHEEDDSVAQTSTEEFP